VHPIGSDQPRHRRIRKHGAQARSQTAVLPHREDVGQHRSGVPVQVAEPAFGITPARAPWDARDDERGRLALWRRSDLNEGVLQRIEPVDAVGKAVDAARRHVELERELPAGGSRRAEAVAPPVLVLGEPHDTRREVQQARQPLEVARTRRRAVPAREHRARRPGRSRPAARKLDHRQARRIRLAVRWERRQHVGLKVPQDARIFDGPIPLAPGLVRGEPVIQASGVAGGISRPVWHAGTHKRERKSLAGVTTAHPESSLASDPRGIQGRQHTDGPSPE